MQAQAPSGGKRNGNGVCRDNFFGATTFVAPGSTTPHAADLMEAYARRAGAATTSPRARQWPVADEACGAAAAATGFAAAEVNFLQIFTDFYQK